MDIPLESSLPQELPELFPTAAGSPGCTQKVTETCADYDYLLFPSKKEWFRSQLDRKYCSLYNLLEQNF